MVGKIDFDNWINDGEPRNTATGSFYDTVLNNLDDLSKGDSSKLNNPFESKRFSRDRRKETIIEHEEIIMPFGTGRIEKEVEVETKTLTEEEYKNKATTIANKLFGEGVVEINTLEEVKEDLTITSEEEEIEESTVTLEKEEVSTLEEIKEDLTITLEEEEPTATLEELSEDALESYLADTIIETCTNKTIDNSKVEFLKSQRVKKELLELLELIPTENNYEYTNTILLEFLRRKPKINNKQLDAFNLLYTSLKSYNKLRHRVDDNIKINKYLKSIKLDLALRG